MIVMTPEATDAEIADVKLRLETIEHLHILVLPGELTTAIGAIGDPEGVAELGLEGMPGVDRVVPISRPFKLASSELGHRDATVIEVGKSEGIHFAYVPPAWSGHLMLKSCPASLQRFKAL